MRATTLVEVLIVLAIMALISGGVAMVVIPEWRRAEITQSQNDLKVISATLDAYHRDHTDCPTVEDLKNGKHMKGNIVDPWSHPYQILTVGAECSVYSLGPDGKANTDDDLCEPANTCGGQK
jgi:general secretion pathway protein G